MFLNKLIIQFTYKNHKTLVFESVFTWVKISQYYLRKKTHKGQNPQFKKRFCLAVVVEKA